MILYRILCFLGLPALLCCLISPPSAAGQQPSFTPSGQQTRTSESPADTGYQTVPKLDSATVNYYCYAPSRRPSSLSLTISDITAANPGVATITSHGFNQYATILVRISGGTGDWTAVNGLRILTYADANTFTIGVNTTMFEDFTDSMQSLTVTTFAVRESDTLWAIKKLVLDGSGNLIFSGWASAAAATSQTSTDVTLVGGRTQYVLACASRATYGYQ